MDYLMDFDGKSSHSNPFNAIHRRVAHHLQGATARRSFPGATTTSAVNANPGQCCCYHPRRWTFDPLLSATPRWPSSSGEGISINNQQLTIT